MRQFPQFSIITGKHSSSLRIYHFFTFLLFFSFHSFAQVGINTTSPTTTLDVNGSLSLRESPGALTLKDGVNKDIVLAGETTFSQYRIEGPEAAFSIDGIKAVDTPDGQILRLINTTKQPMTIINNSLGNGLKILCPSEINLVLAGENSSVTLQYSKGLGKWTVFGYASRKDKNIYYVTNSSAAISKSNNNWEDIQDMEITFTPVNPIVFVTYSIHGDVIKPSSASRPVGHFRITKNSDPVKHTEVRLLELKDREPYQALLPMYPLSVTPGIQITLKVQWVNLGDGSIIHNNPEYNSHGRYMTIMD